MIDKIKKTSDLLSQEQANLDLKLLNLLENQIANKSIGSGNSEEEHMFVLKIANEISRIKINISFMPQDIKGLKQIKASLKRLLDNFLARGYEVIDMINKEYDPQLRVIANFRPEESFEKGKQVITRVIKPQVNYNGVMIQTAEVEVSVGE